MIDEFNSQEKLDRLFKQAKLYHPDNAYLIAYSTWPTSAVILGGAGTAMTRDVDSAYGGYLVSIGESRLHLLPLSKRNTKSGISSASRMSLADGKPVVLEKKNIESVKIYPANGLSFSTKSVTIKMNNGKKYVWLVNKQEKALPYHQKGYAALQSLSKSVGTKTFQ